MGKFGRLFTRVPVVGGLISFAISMMMGEKIGRAAARAVGSTAGAALGTLIPFPGVGTILGGFLGDIVGGGLYDVLEAYGKPKKHATGGQVGGRRGRRPTRQIRQLKTQKPQKQIRQRTMPGKNVGGEDEIKKLYPEIEDEKMMSPLRLLKKNAALMKRAGVLGNLLSSGVEMMALGQKIERSTLIGLEKYLAYVIDSSIQDQSKQNVRTIASSMFAMADGGVVPVSRSLNASGTSTGSMVAKEIVKSFTTMLDNRSVEIFQNIRRELELKSPENAAPTGEPGEGGGLQVTSSSPDFWLLATLALFEGISPQGYADVAQAIYNRVAMPGDPWKVNGSIRTAILAPKQFSPVGNDFATWDRIKDKESAIQFIKSKGKTQEQLEAAAAAILDTSRQNSARTFVGPRDNFRSYQSEANKNHLADDTEVKREGHVFGFEHRGATIQAFRAGKLKPAEINKRSIAGKVENLGSKNVTLEEIRLLAESMGLQLTSYLRSNDPDSLHYKGLAMDFSNGIDTPQQLAFAKKVAKRYGKNLAELIYTPLGYGIKDGKVVKLEYWGDKTNREHYDHVHVGVYRNTKPSPNTAQNNNLPSEAERAARLGGSSQRRPTQPTGINTFINPLLRPEYRRSSISEPLLLQMASSQNQQYATTIPAISKESPADSNKTILLQPILVG